MTKEYVEPANIPVVDFRALTSENSQERKAALNQLDQAFQTYGFIYLSNHSIGQKLVDEAFSWSQRFFHLPTEVKELCKHNSVAADHRGWEGPNFEEVHIVSGVCLFNARLLEMSATSPQTGGVDVDLLKNSIPTYNELDYIARGSSAIADIAAMNISRAREQGSGQRLEIKLDVPSWHYFHTVTAKFASTQCSNTEVLQWMDTIDQRHDQIGQTFVKAIRDGLEQRGIRDSTSYGISITSRTSPAAVLIRTAIEHDEVPSLESILAAYDSEEDGCWKRFYGMIPTKERPSDLDQLGYLFYVYEAIRPSLVERPQVVPPASDKTKTANLSKKALKKRKPRRLIISVDDTAERRIYSRAQRILSKIRQSSEKPETYLVESYVCRRFLINGNEARARLGRLDPLPEIPVRTGSHQETLLPLDVVRQLYGDNSALDLQRWLQEAGLPV